MLRVGAGGQGYADDSGPVTPVCCHLGDGLSRYRRDRAGVEALLDAIADAGYDGVRTWTVLGDRDGTVGYWRGREIGPWQADYLDVVVGFREALRARGLRWLLSQGDLCAAIPSQEKRRAVMESLARVLLLEDLIGIDAGNEAWQNGEADPVALQDLIDAFRGRLPVPIWSLTSPPGEEQDEILRYAGTVGDVHSYRGGRWWDKVRHVFTTGYETITDRPVIQSEPPGPGSRVSVTEHQAELTEGPLVALAVAAAITGQLWVYFSGPGVISDEAERLDAMPGFRAVPQILRALPEDLGQGALHGGIRWQDRRIYAAEGDMRADQVRLSGGRFVALLYGPDARQVERAQPVRPVDVLWSWERPGVRVVSGRLH